MRHHIPAVASAEYDGGYSNSQAGFECGRKSVWHRKSSVKQQGSNYCRQPRTKGGPDGYQRRFPARITLIKFQGVISAR